MSNSYENRKYRKDTRTGEILDYDVMYDGDERIVGIEQVRERLKEKVLLAAKQMGKKEFGSGDFKDFFEVRGPSHGDIIRSVLDWLVLIKKMQKLNVGTAKKARYKYILLSKA